MNLSKEFFDSCSPLLRVCPGLHVAFTVKEQSYWTIPILQASDTPWWSDLLHEFDLPTKQSSPFFMVNHNDASSSSRLRPCFIALRDVIWR